MCRTHRQIARLSRVRALAGTALLTGFVLTQVWIPAPARAAGAPVEDVDNLAQNVLTAIESVAQTGKQIEEYKTQLKQYKNQLKNTAVPATYIWDQALKTIANLKKAIDTLTYFKKLLGSVDAYAAKFQDENFYRKSKCFTSGGCSPEELEKLKENARLASEAQKKANDALLAGLDRQQAAMVADAQQLESLQASAESATGQMQALQSASMLASHQSNQLLQIRALLIAGQNVLATQAQATADREAKQGAATQQLRSGKYTPSPQRTW